MTKSTSSLRTKKIPGNPSPGAAVRFATASFASVEDEIRTRAYQLYEEEGRQEGRDLEYWFRAEAEVRPRRRQLPN